MRVVRLHKNITINVLNNELLLDSSNAKFAVTTNYKSTLPDLTKVFFHNKLEPSLVHTSSTHVKKQGSTILFSTQKPTIGYTVTMLL